MKFFRRNLPALLALLALIATASVAFTGCATWGTRYQETEPSYTVRSADNSFQLRSPWIPGLEAHGVIERGLDEHTLYVEAVRLFANWPNGWTDAQYEASGTFRAQRDHAGQWTVTLVEPIELWGIQSGEIRYFDNYIRGELGIMRTKARLDRVEAVSAWINEAAHNDPERQPWHPRRRANRDGPTAAARVREFVKAAQDEGTVPEWFEPLWASGTYERDVVEAPDLFALFVNLSRMVGRTAVLEEETL